MRKKLHYENNEISYLIRGEGKVVMLVHGFGETGQVWTEQLAHLENKFRVIVPDLPGSGSSGYTGGLTMESMAGRLKSILDSEGINEVILIGHSMGGYITLAFAELFPGYLKAMGLFSSTAVADTDEKKISRQKGISFILKNGGREFLSTSSPNLFSPETRVANPGLIKKFLDSSDNFSDEALVNYYEAMMQRPDRQHILTSTKSPVLIVLGKEDTAIPFEDGLKLCPLPRIAYIHVLQHSGHMGMLEEPLKSSEILEKFLTECSAANP